MAFLDVTKLLYACDPSRTLQKDFSNRNDVGFPLGQSIIDIRLEMSCNVLQLIVRPKIDK